MTIKRGIEWWEDKGGFFGSSYMEGDDSLTGYLPDRKETLEERTKREIDGIISLVNPGRWILDVPCGYGRHSIELAKRGYNVLGVDLNGEHLKKANAEKEINKYIIERNNGACGFYRADIRDLRKSGHNKNYWSYDTIINMFYSFGFFKDEKEDRNVMKGLYSVLSPGGELLIHTDISPEMILKGGNYKMSEHRELRSGRTLYIEERYDPVTKRMNGSWTIYGKNRRKEKLTPYSVRIYSSDEFRSMAIDSGFLEVNIYGSFDGRPFTPDCGEMIVVARRLQE
jgi:SAM-dependent methyltransferase